MTFNTEFLHIIKEECKEPYGSTPNQVVTEDRERGLDVKGH